MESNERLPTILAERVRLRWIEERDVDDLFAIFSDPDLLRYWSSGPMVEVVEARALMNQIHERFQDGSLFQWGIATLEDDRVIGTSTLYAIDRKNGRAEIGFILRASCHGRGYAREAVAAVIDHAFRSLGLRRIEADVDPRNEASIRLLEGLGFVREGVLRERWCVDGKITDTLLLGLLRREWSAG